jgi:ribosomal protein L11 methylase PrmA
MLTLAAVGPKDFVIDLGSGDGRIVLTAAKVFGARGFGVDINEKLVKEANESARLQGVADRAKFTIQDLFKTDISKATVVTMYLLPNTVNMLRDKLLNELSPGTRVLNSQRLSAERAMRVSKVLESASRVLSVAPT